MPASKHSLWRLIGLFGLGVVSNPIHSEPILVNRAELPNGAPFSHYELRNGLTLYLVENHSAPVLTYQTWFQAGSQDEKMDPRIQATGLAHLVEHLMFRGTSNHPGGDFSRILTQIGGQNLDAITWLDESHYYQSIPAHRLGLLTELEADRMSNLVLDQKRLEAERSVVWGELRARIDEPTVVSLEKLYERAFVRHPYRYATIGTEPEIRRFRLEDANYFYRNYYTPNRATVLIVGDVDPISAAKIVDSQYGALAPRVLELPPMPLELPQTTERQVEFTHAQLKGTHLRLGYHAPVSGDSDHPALQLVLAILAQGEGSLLREAWVNRGLAVSLNGNLDRLRDPGLFNLQADLQAGHQVSELLGVLDRTLFELESETNPLLTERVLERARNQTLLAVYGQWDENLTLANFMGEFVGAHQSPLDAFEWVARLERMTLDDLRRVIRTYLRSEQRTTVVGRPENGS